MEEEKQRKMYERGSMRGHPYPPPPGPPGNDQVRHGSLFHCIMLN
jgi:hypothetical protein